MFLPFEIDTDEPLPYAQSTPWCVYGIIAACVLIHGWLSLEASAPARLDIFYRFGAMRFQFRPWMPLTCMFLHGGWGHLVGNMFMLWVYGRELERFIGSVRFVILYFLGGVLSVAIHLLTLSAMFADQPTIGASGAISGVLGAFLIYWPVARLRCLFFSPIAFRPIVVRLPAFVVLGLWFIGQLFSSLGIIAVTGGIAFWAHAAGFAVGAAVAYVYRVQTRRQEDDFEASVKRPLFDIWGLLASGDRYAASEQCSGISREKVGDCYGVRDFLCGWGLAEAGDAEGAGLLMRSLCQARDYRSDALVLSAYLQLCRWADMATIPPHAHRDAGLAAYGLGHRELAMCAFKRSVEAGCSEGLEPVLRAVEATLRRRKSG